MNKVFITIVGGVTSLIATEAAAAPPAWCKGAEVEATVSQSGKDVIAIWPSAAARAPSMVLGGALR